MDIHVVIAYLGGYGGQDLDTHVTQRYFAESRCHPRNRVGKPLSLFMAKDQQRLGLTMYDMNVFLSSRCALYGCC